MTCTHRINHWLNPVICALFLLSTFSLKAQFLQITGGNTPPIDPQNLITNIFLGEGVQVTNVTYNGANAAVGYFTGGTQSVGIERGIILTSGFAASQGGSTGGDQTGANFANNGNGSTAFDADLAAVSSANLNDVAVYVIKFIPTSDTLRFRYCFGSEEYPEYACSQFNDVFGFFIQGPGYPSPTNIAKIPNTTLPVTINNIHPANPIYACPPMNQQYYNNNNNSGNQPSYDGFTDVFIAEAIVTPCQEYTIKLAIADAGDAAYDSGVFLEAKSFGTGSLQVEVNTVSLDGTVTEGCAQGSITFSLPVTSSQAFPIDYTIIGTATNGVDYETIPSNLVIPAGQTQVTVPVIAIEDGMAETGEFLAIDVQRDPCNRDTFYIYLRDNGLLPPNLMGDTTVCLGAPALLLDATLPIPLPPPPTFSNTQDYTITPTNTAITSPVNVFGVQPVTLADGVIRSVCMDITHPWVDDLDVFLLSPGGQFLELTTDNGANGDNYTQTCFTPAASTVISSPGPFAPASAAPFTNSWLPEGPFSDLWDGSYPSNGTWRLQVIDDSNGFTGTINEWTITFEPSYKVNYAWYPAVGLSCPTCPATDADPTETTLYKVYATDSYGCVIEDSIRIEVKPIIEAPVIDCGEPTANTVTFTWLPISGTLGYQVNVEGTGWIGPIADTFFVVGGLSPDSAVTIEVRAISPSAECVAPSSVATCINCIVPVVSLATEPTSCFGVADGELVLTPDGINPPYSYEIQGQSNNNGVFTGIAAGDYIATVTDNNGCEKKLPFSITSPQALTANTQIVQQVSCFGGANGSASVAFSGGTGSATYTWSDPNGQTGNIASNLTAGTYSVTVTDANGCQSTATATVTQPADIILNAGGTNALCFGQSSGVLNATASGGNIPYNFVWSGGQTGPIVNNVPAGSYAVTLTDGNGCAKTALASIGQPTQVTATTTSVPTDCAGGFDGTATVLPAGGTGIYQYTWSDPAQQTTPTATGLPAQNYFVTVTDANGCSTIQSVIVSSPPAVSVTLSVGNATCFSAANGTLQASPAGGVGNFNFTWSSGQSGANVSGLLAGTYTVTVFDGNGCSQTASASISQPAVLTLASSVTDASCFGSTNGSIQVNGQGGTSPYGYAWNVGGGGPILNNMPAGVYTVTLTDAQGCTLTLSETIEQPSEIVAIPSMDAVDCFGENTGSIQINTNGGAGGFTINWTGPNGYTGFGNTIQNLFAGNYNATVTDANGCKTFVNQPVTQPAQPLSTLLPYPADTICFGASDGTATVAVTGGTSPYSYLWSTGGQTAPTATGLNATIEHEVTITDANGCVTTNSTIVQEKQEMFVWVEAGSSSCHDGKDGRARVTIIYYGIDPAPDLNAFTYQWSTTPSQSGLEATGLQALQTYTVTVTDQQGCTDEQSAVVGNPPELFAQIDTVSNVKCHGDASGWASASGLGGNAPYTFFWGPNAQAQTGATAENLQAGAYKVTVTDALGCFAIATLNILEPERLDVNLLAQHVLCYGESSGQATAIPSGGVGPYTISWENGQTGANASGLTAGYVQIALSDQNDCRLTDSVEIRQPSAPLAGVSEKIDATCFGDNDGRITIIGSGGTPPYQYALNNAPFNGSSVQIALQAGTYTPVMRDKNGCIFNLPPVEVSQRAPVLLDLGADITLELGETTQLFADVSGAAGNVLYIWEPADSNWLSCLDCPEPYVDTLFYNHTFDIKVVDELGCTAEDRIEVIVEKPRKIFVPTGFTPNGDFNNDVLLVHGQASAKVLDFRVFDRWGELVYQAQNFTPNDQTTGWDGNFRGKAMDPGVFVWIVEVEYMDGVREVFKGNTTLIR